MLRIRFCWRLFLADFLGVLKVDSWVIVYGGCAEPLIGQIRVLGRIHNHSKNYFREFGLMRIVRGNARIGLRHFWLRDTSMPIWDWQRRETERTVMEASWAEYLANEKLKKKWCSSAILRSATCWRWKAAVHRLLAETNTKGGQ
ncbi:hypothetical protein OPV22_020219 [Ensete ventricosum]|uniref:Uncharacterized protein n=1 Tax=Ensete ventricosum TaxID=4639 RepID=A0AAV8QKV8_ENSVE|nr:hypothetical protein OPV22_020219 [Ensete ventricosum]